MFYVLYMVLFLDTDDPEIGSTQVTYLESLFLSSDWKTITQLLTLHQYFYSTKDRKAVRDLTIDNKNALNLIQVSYVEIFI